MRRGNPFRVALAALLVAALLGLGACATRAPVSPATSVVLLPDDDGKVGAVSVSTPAGTQWLDAALSRTTVASAGAAPSQARPMSQDAVESTYGTLLKRQAHRTRTFVLHFERDKTELTAASKDALPALFAAARDRGAGNMVVLGHADASGSPARNLRLSAERAEAVARMLRQNAPELDEIDVQYFGETMPLSDTGSNGPDARNRRVEILML